MEAGQLRIGNYILNDGVVVKADGRTIFDIWSGTSKNYQPIPITEELIDKKELGFQHRYGKTYYFGKMKFDFNSLGKLRFHWSGKVTYIDYFHQLQNVILELTGEELTLNT